MPELVSTCLWAASPEVIAALADRLGDPVDAYVNGSQVWIDDDGPVGVSIEWRLHPVGGYVRPRGVATHDVFDAAVGGKVDPTSLWDGLEAFAAYGDELTVDVLRTWASARLGVPVTASGTVDHDVVADAWERSERTTSIVGDLLAQLRNSGGAADLSC